MAKPVNKREKANRSKVFAILAGIGVIYLSLHVPSQWDGTADSIDAIMMHMVFSPLDIFPIDTQALSVGVGIAVIAMLLIYQHYLNNQRLRPGEESGSASWNENLPKFYKTYADITTKFSLPRIKIKGLLFKIINDILAKFESFLFGWSVKPNEDTGGANSWEPVRKDSGMMTYKHRGTKNMILSQDVVLSMDTRKTLRNNNILVIGGSGTGKSRFMIKPNMLQLNSSFVITDPSGELLETMGGVLKEQGYDIRVFNLVQMDHSNCYNPFNYIRDEKGVLSMINALIKNTTPKGSSTSDPFWEKAETALLQAICFFLVEECNPDEQNFSSVMKLLRCVDAGEGAEDKKSVLDILMDELAEKKPNHIANQSYAVFKSAGGGKTAQSILISCQTRLQTFNIDEIATLTNTDNIDLKSVGDKPTALFCITPVADTTFNYLVALLYTQLFETLYFHAQNDCEGLRLPIHVRFLLDEFANIGTIPEFNEKLATMRKHEISCTIVIQALSQLKTMYKDDWEVIVGNCDTLLFLGGSDATTLDYISKKLGKETIRAKNTSRSFGKSGSSSVSMNSTGRELMQPDELAGMDNKNCIVFIRGEHPFFTTKYEYTKHPNYKLTGDADKDQLFNVKEAVTTKAAPPVVSAAQQKNRRIRRQANRSKDPSADMARRQRQRQAENDKILRRRNAAIKEAEARILDGIDTDVDSVDEFIEKNNFGFTPEEFENAITKRFEIDDISDFYGEEDGFTSELNDEVLEVMNEVYNVDELM